jgi:phosphohistidine phosphatase
LDLYVIRHADALALGERGITQDEDRPLSETGEQQAKGVGAGLQARGLRPAVIVTSPLVRARQTAEAIQRQFPEQPGLQVCEHLAPGGKRKRLARFLRRLAGSAVAVVGHQPDLAQWAAWVIGGKKAQLDLPKAGVALIRCPDGPRKRGGTLMWLVGPEWFGAGDGA